MGHRPVGLLLFRACEWIALISHEQQDGFQDDKMELACRKDMTNSYFTLDGHSHDHHDMKIKITGHSDVDNDLDIVGYTCNCLQHAPSNRHLLFFVRKKYVMVRG